MEEYELEEFAEIAVEDIESFINIELKVLKKEHKFEDNLENLDYILLHLNERVPSKDKHLHDLNAKIMKKLRYLRGKNTSRKLRNLKFKKEEEKILKKLKEDIKHKDWKAVKIDVALEKKEKKKIVKSEISELKKLHKKVTEITILMEENDINKAINQDIKEPRQKQEFEKIEHYYFLKIYKFFKTYEDIFENLLKKEEKLIE
ncbi:hypothetical protein GF361_02765 [Candidatus Woesearchaeota archaeon]|nr:hypothetical protein [Candidatus Woesearchaeota archaeon]